MRVPKIQENLDRLVFEGKQKFHSPYRIEGWSPEGHIDRHCHEQHGEADCQPLRFGKVAVTVILEHTSPQVVFAERCIADKRIPPGLVGGLGDGKHPLHISLALVHRQPLVTREIPGGRRAIDRLQRNLQNRN